MTDFGSTETDLSSDDHEGTGSLGTEGPESGEQLTPGGAPEVGDYDGDGYADYLVQWQSDGSIVVVTDENGDQLADTVGVDLTGDGTFDGYVVRDGENYIIQRDLDGDGKFEDEQIVTRAELEAVDPAAVAALDMQFGPGDTMVAPIDPGVDPGTEALPVEPSEPRSEFVSDGQLVGDPTGDSEHWFEQAVNGFCVPASVAQIVSEYTGEHHADEQHFIERANELKVFEVGSNGVPGVGIDGALALLEDAGVPASIEFGTGVETLVDYLDDGRRVVLAVDSGEMWEGEATEDNAADHAIVVTGVDLERGVVIVSDPGDPDGNQRECPIEEFEDAWQDSGFAAAVCDEPPASFDAAAEPSTTEPAAFEDSTVAEPGTGEPAAFETVALPDGWDASEVSQTERVTGWMVAAPWAVLPVLLAARLVAARKSSSS